MPFKLLRKLEQEAREVDWRGATKNAETVAARCEVAWQTFERTKAVIEAAAPTVEQLKGVVKGMEVAGQIVAQYKAILQARAKEEKITKEEFLEKAAVIDEALRGLAEGRDKQREELIRAAGKIDGIYSSAQETLAQIRDYLSNLARQERMLEEMEADGSRPAARPGNGQNAEVKGAIDGSLRGATVEKKKRRGARAG